MRSDLAIDDQTVRTLEGAHGVQRVWPEVPVCEDPQRSLEPDDVRAAAVQPQHDVTRPASQLDGDGATGVDADLAVDEEPMLALECANGAIGGSTEDAVGGHPQRALQGHDIGPGHAEAEDPVPVRLRAPGLCG